MKQKSMIFTEMGIDIFLTYIVSENVWIEIV